MRGLSTGETNSLTTCYITASAGSSECWESSQWASSSDFPQTHIRILIFLSLLIDSARWYTWLPCLNQSTHRGGFINTIFRIQVEDRLRELVSNRDLRFTAEFWRSVFNTFGKLLQMYTSDHPETDGQTGSAKCTLEEMFQGCVHFVTNWSELLPMV